MNRIIITLLALLLTAGITAEAKKNSLFTPQRVEAAKKAAQTDSLRAEAMAKIIATADGLIAKPNLAKSDYLGLAYMLTGDTRYSDAARDILLKGTKAASWADKEMMMRNPPWQSELQMAHKLFAVACAYEAIYPTLTPAQRREIAQGYYRLAVKPLAEDWLLPQTRIHTYNSMGHNWWSSCVGMCGLGALAFADEVPQCREIIDHVNTGLKGWWGFEGDVMQHKPRTFDRNGGMYESINYAYYGCQEALLYMLALKNATGRSLGTIPQVAQCVPFFMATAYPVAHGPMMTTYFGDSHKTTTAHNTMMLIEALGLGNSDTAWYLANVDQNQHREFYGLDTPMGFLYEPATRSKATPTAPTSAIFPDMGWATMRTGWDDDATMLAVKSGMTWNHSHADAGSFILFHKGRDIIGEAGRCWYALPDYRSYYFQSQAHNVVTLNGQGQPTFQQYHGSSIPGSLSGLTDTLGVRYILADATGPNSDRFNRYMRSFLWIDDAVLIIDDLCAHTEGTYQWLWHPVGTATKRGIDLDVTNGGAHVVLRQLYPETVAPSAFVHDYPAKMTWDVIEANGEDNKAPLPYYRYNLPGKHSRVKGLTGILLEPDRSDLTARHGDDWIGTRITHSDGKITDVYVNQLADGSLMHLNSWIHPDGWDTDAYILALTYPDAKALEQHRPCRTAMVYGSTLRDSQGRVIKSDHTKRNLVW